MIRLGGSAHRSMPLMLPGGVRGGRVRRGASSIAGPRSARQTAYQDASFGPPASPHRPSTDNSRLVASLFDRFLTWTIVPSPHRTSTVARRTTRPDSIRFRSDQIDDRPDAQSFAYEATQWFITLPSSSNSCAVSSSATS